MEEKDKTRRWPRWTWRLRAPRRGHDEEVEEEGPQPHGGGGQDEVGARRMRRLQAPSQLKEDDEEGARRSWASYFVFCSNASKY